MEALKMILVGAGNRASVYAALSEVKSDKMQIVGMVEPDPVRAGLMRERFRIPEENCMKSLDELMAREKFADAVINGTMDQMHVATSIPVLEKGYDLLLEKPFCVNEEELWRLWETAERTGRKVMICHVLRYSPFYRAIKEHIASGEIGRIVNVSLAEHVAYHHMGASFLRGKWAMESECGSPLLLAKSCHDMDLMMWLNDASRPVRVSSFAGDFQYRPECKPAGAGTHCLLDCPKEIEEKCMYSARANYLEPEIRWQQYVYKSIEGQPLTYENCLNSLMKKDNPFSRCVWDCPHDLVDHQSVSVLFENGSTGQFSLVAGAARAERSVHIIGEKGEIKGVFQDNVFCVRKPGEGTKYEETVYDLNKNPEEGNFGGHGGGDLRLAEDFVDYVREGVVSLSCTKLENSLASHLTVFRAEKSRRSGMVEKVFETK